MAAQSLSLIYEESVFLMEIKIFKLVSTGHTSTVIELSVMYDVTFVLKNASGTQIMPRAACFRK
jgi:hypothetical protein